MRKILRFASAVLVLLMLCSLSVLAFDDVEIVGTYTAPVIDGKLDDCYTKLHDFYGTADAEWPGGYDDGNTAKGECWATWDEDNLYVWISVKESDYKPDNNPTVTTSGSCIYYAILATTPNGDQPDDGLHVCQLAVNRDADGNIAWKYTGSVDEKYRDNSVDMAIYKTAPFDAYVLADGTNTAYEIALPWDQIDRKGDVDFTEGHQFTFNYIVCFNDGSAIRIVQYGQGLINDIYDCGGIATLVPGVIEEEDEAAVEEAAAETAAVSGAPKTADFSAAALILTSVLGSALVIRKRR